MTAKRHKGWWLVVAAYALLIFGAAVCPVDPLPDVRHLDKVLHLCEYWLFAWLLVQAIRAGRLVEPEYLVLAWMFATSYGLLIEVVQGLLPWRQMDLLDAATNAIGAAGGTFLMKFRRS